MMKQEIIHTSLPLEALAGIFSQRGVQRLLLVCDRSFPRLDTYTEYRQVPGITAVFDDFSPNPLYEEICRGVSLFQRSRCDGILAIGGGSAIDTAKCIRAFAQMPPGSFYLAQPFHASSVPLAAVPTTAGTGSESTRYAVVYYEGRKQSITDDSLLPDYALLDARNLKTLPLYQKKCTLLDALCQSIESWWSIHATQQSRCLSQKALRLILIHLDDYLFGQFQAAACMLQASNLAGQAIHITQTTAAHAMNYKLTSLYRIPHGRAAFACLPHVWEYMLAHSAQKDDLLTVFQEIAAAMNCSSPESAIRFLRELDQRLFSDNPVRVDPSDIPLLASSVNPTRLHNNPVPLDLSALTLLYTQILQEIPQP